MVTALESNGLYAVACVKTATSNFPKAYLQNQQYPTRGAYVTMQGELEGTALIAISWRDFSNTKAAKSEGKLKMFIATAGSNARGEDHVKKRYSADGKRVEFKVQRPQIVVEYYNSANAIDVHNHLRQGGLNLEEAWRTETWWMRLYATFVGMIETNAYLAYSRLHPRADRDPSHDISHRRFTDTLAYALCHNTFDRPLTGSLREREVAE